MRDDRDDRRDPEELDERVEELEERVRRLRDELGRPPEGPLGLPRPPSPSEVLSFTGEYAIPTAIAVLEANVRALQALQQVIRVLDPERSVVGEERDRLESRAADASRATLDRLETALEDVENVVRESDLPREGEARDILEDARRINREIRDRVDRSRRDADEARGRERGRGQDRGREQDRDRRDEDARQRGRDGERENESDRDDFEERSTTIDLSDPGEDGEADGDDAVQVDVDAELRSIKDELEHRDDDVTEADGEEVGDGGEGETDGDEGNETDAGEDAEADDEPSDDSNDDA
ncbi:DUF7547 family protein [Halorussus amylolyticus]|uniref:DUF7547 family protein n=1 Tax=Halorussus amylolyticus TaxID=1126242 RepID=UPI00104B848C|nr:hypothetical protein [Halorussus amylolyticus]